MSSPERIRTAATALRERCRNEPPALFGVVVQPLPPVGGLAARTDCPDVDAAMGSRDTAGQHLRPPDGELLRVSGPRPGAVHDLTAARIWGILRELAASGLVVLADKGYAGAGDHVRIPYRGRGKTWCILRKLRCCPWRAGIVIVFAATPSRLGVGPRPPDGFDLLAG
jgi:DDE superfamily endonuclease